MNEYNYKNVAAEYDDLSKLLMKFELSCHFPMP